MSAYLPNLSSLSGVAIAATSHFRTLPQQIVGRQDLVRVGVYTALAAAVTTAALYYLRPVEGSFKKEHIQEDPISGKVFAHLDFVNQLSWLEASQLVKGTLSSAVIGMILNRIFKPQKLWTPHLINMLVLLPLVTKIAAAILDPVYAWAAKEPAPLSLEAVQIERLITLRSQGCVQDSQDPTAIAMQEFLAKLREGDQEDLLEAIENPADALKKHFIVGLISKKAAALKKEFGSSSLFSEADRGGGEGAEEQAPLAQKELLGECYFELQQTAKKFSEGDGVPQDLKAVFLALIEATGAYLSDLDREINPNPQGAVLLAYKALGKELAKEQESSVQKAKARDILKSFDAVSEAAKAIFPSHQDSKAAAVKRYYQKHLYKTFNRFLLKLVARMQSCSGFVDPAEKLAQIFTKDIDAVETYAE